MYKSGDLSFLGLEHEWKGYNTVGINTKPKHKHVEERSNVDFKYSLSGFLVEILRRRT